jgi:adenylate cyclase
MKKYFFFCILLFSIEFSFAQDQKSVDSLLSVLKTVKQDSAKANILDALSKVYWGNNSEKAMDYAKQELTLSEQCGYKKGIGNAYNSIGVVHKQNGNYFSAMEFHKKALKISEEINDKAGIAFSYLNIGNIYFFQGIHPEALKNYFSSLKLSEEIGDRQNTGWTYSNIGNIYEAQAVYPEALKNYEAALKIFESTGDKKYIAGLNLNIASIYVKQGNYSAALSTNSKALKTAEEVGFKYGIANAYYTYGSIYDGQGNYSEALKNMQKASKIFEETSDMVDKAEMSIAIGNIYSKLKNYKIAYEYLNDALTLSKQIGSIEDIETSYEGLAKLDNLQGNPKLELEHYKQFIIYRDSVVNDKNTTKITQQQMQYDFDKKESSAKAEQEKKDAIALKEIQKQKLVRNGFVGGFAVVLLFAGVFFTQRNKIKSGKQRSDELLLNILPSEVAEELKAKGSADAKQFDGVTVMFTDFKNFTHISEKLTPSELVAEIHTCFKAFDDIIGNHNIEKIKTIGDAYMCAGGLPVANKTNATDVVSAALEIQHFMQKHLQQRKNEGKEPFEIRIGVHTGPVVAGIVGVKKFAYDIWGDTVNIASRMESSGEAGKVNISGSTYELVKDKFNCIHRGKIQAKNKGEIDMYFVQTVS